MTVKPFSVLVGVCLLAGQSVAQTKTETLLFSPPGGFALSYKRGNIAEWVRIGETVYNWSEMITLQLTEPKAGLTPADYLAGVAKFWMMVCPHSRQSGPVSGQTNGYASSMQVLFCQLNKSTGKPETTVFLAIRGKERMYSLQRAFRSIPSAEKLSAAKKYLATISVCDYGRPGHPCPPNLHPKTLGAP